jgi:hypothetical protein
VVRIKVQTPPLPPVEQERKTVKPRTPQSCMNAGDTFPIS